MSTENMRNMSKFLGFLTRGQCNVWWRKGDTMFWISYDLETQKPRNSLLLFVLKIPWKVTGSWKMGIYIATKWARRNWKQFAEESHKFSANCFWTFESFWFFLSFLKASSTRNHRNYLEKFLKHCQIFAQDYSTKIEIHSELSSLSLSFFPPVIV